MVLRLGDRDAVGDRRVGVKGSGERENERNTEGEGRRRQSPPKGGHYVLPSACSTNASGGSAPSISTESLTTVFGTPVTAYFLARSGNSVASTANAVMFG